MHQRRPRGHEGVRDRSPVPAPGPSRIAPIPVASAVVARAGAPDRPWLLSFLARSLLRVKGVIPAPGEAAGKTPLYLPFPPGSIILSRISAGSVAAPEVRGLFNKICFYSKLSGIFMTRELLT